MSEIKLSNEELRYMALFSDVTGVDVRDCIIDSDSSAIVFIVPPGKAGLAIGNRGTNVKRLSKILGKRIEVIEWADNLEDFVKNLFLPARVLGTSLMKLKDSRKILYVRVNPEDKGLAIGKSGRNVNKARTILKRYFDIDVVSIV
ncbi:MAG: NusA-like transcription termination signal-binding factor [Sulfolobales archaeon]|nr:NusA-like transcription termination signal-binding factor [Sulfolobales archaeon]MDW8083219.1 NusA-like transcription termination signal-binding factor [Sulfolobales archaeon]